MNFNAERVELRRQVEDDEISKTEYLTRIRKLHDDRDNKALLDSVTARKAIRIFEEETGESF